MAGSGQKTEEPTQRRLEETRKEGKFPASREFVAGIQFVTFVFLLQSYGRNLLESIVATMRAFLRRAMEGRNVGPEEVVLLLQNGTPLLWGLIAGGGILMLATFSMHLATTQFGFAFNKLAPDFKQSPKPENN